MTLKPCIVLTIAIVGVTWSISPSPRTAKAQEPTSKTVTAKRNSAVVPVPRPRRENWMKRHKEFNERAKKGDVDLLFIGDSITEGWDDDGKEVWAKYYGSRKASNIGFSGDRTQHILWRLDHGNVDGIQPKLVVLMIGTNNWQDNTMEEIAEGVETVVHRLNEKLPKSKVLLMAILPRDDHVKETREKFKHVNERIAKLADGKTVTFLDLTAKFLNPDGKLNTEALPDLVHLGPKGFEIWAEAIEPEVAAAVGKQ